VPPQRSLPRHHLLHTTCQCRLPLTFLLHIPNALSLGGRYLQRQGVGRTSTATAILLSVGLWEWVGWWHGLNRMPPSRTEMLRASMWMNRIAFTATPLAVVAGLGYHAASSHACLTACHLLCLSPLLHLAHLPLPLTSPSLPALSVSASSSPCLTLLCHVSPPQVSSYSPTTTLMGRAGGRCWKRRHAEGYTCAIHHAAPRLLGWETPRRPPHGGSRSLVPGRVHRLPLACLTAFARLCLFRRLNATAALMALLL